MQKAYLSRVLKEDAELDQDQLFLACEHLGIVNLEREFLFALHAFCRSDVPARRQRLAEQLASLREQANQTLGHIQIAAVADDDMNRLAPLFLDPDAQLVQIFLTIEKYRRDPKSLANVLALPPARFDSILDKLRQHGLITVDAEGLAVPRETMHLRNDSPVFRPYRALLRQRVIAQQACLPDGAGYSLSLLFSATPDVEQHIRQRLLALLKETEPRVREAHSEHVYFFGIDLFPWVQYPGK